jgi:predicted permease
MSDLIQDLRYAARMLARRPGLSAITILVLTLGIGGSVSSFSVVDAALYRPLRFDRPDGLFTVWERPPRGAPWTRQTVSFALFREWERQTQSFEQLAGYTGRSFVLRGRQGPEQVRGDVVTPELFDVLGVRAAFGRTLESADRNGPPVVVLSHRLWQQAFGGRSDIVGQSMTLDGVAHVVVGVLRAEAELPTLGGEPALWSVLTSTDAAAQSGSVVAAIGRLKPGVQPSAAEEELKAIQQRVPRADARGGKSEGVLVRSLQDERAQLLRPTLNVGFGAALCLLLVACVNVAGLLLGRGQERQREMAVRAALGASRLRLIRQLVSEQIVLWAPSGVAGILVGAVGLRWFVSVNPFRPDELGLIHGLSIDARAIVFTVVITWLTALIFGVWPALSTSRVNFSSALNSAGRLSTAPRSNQRARNLLIVAQVALSVTVLAGATLLAVSFGRLSSQSLGLDSVQLLTFRLQLPLESYRQDARRWQFHHGLVIALRALPGVAAAGTTSARPLGAIPVAPFHINGQVVAEDARVGFQAVDPDYFETAGIPLLQGRGFDTRDSDRTERVALINATLARKYFVGNPVGQQIGSTVEGAWSTIVGVVGDVKHAGLDWEVLPEVFVPYSQTTGVLGDLLGRDIFGMVRVRNATRMEKEIRTVVSSLDPGLPVVELMGFEDVIDDSAARPRFRTAVIGSFATISLLLAAVGIYGLLSQFVVQRQREFGIRLALGATKREILRQVVSRGLGLSVVGVIVGLVTALAIGRLMQSMLFGVSSRDPVILCGVALLMLFVASAASFVPARRASGIDPIVALRTE